MKTLGKHFIFLVAILLGATACDALEDESLREKYYENAGTPITKAELEKIISVTQPIPNTDESVKGDQYVVIKNNNPKVPGVWYIQTNIGIDKTNTDNDTIVYAANGTYKIYFEALSAGEVVQTDPVYVQVTNIFDPWETPLTGAVDKTDVTAKKTWEFWPSPGKGIVYFNGMYQNWEHFDVERFHDGLNNWDGGGVTLAAAGNYTMVFEFAGSKITTYNPNGTVLKEGNYTFSRVKNTPKLVGELITTIPLIGSQISWAGVKDGQPNNFWLIQFDENHIVVAHPDPTWVNGGDFWNYYAWYGFYKVKE